MCTTITDQLTVNSQTEIPLEQTADNVSTTTTPVQPQSPLEQKIESVATPIFETLGTDDLTVTIDLKSKIKDPEEKEILESSESPVSATIEASAAVDKKLLPLEEKKTVLQKSFDEWANKLTPELSFWQKSIFYFAKQGFANNITNCESFEEIVKKIDEYDKMTTKYENQLDTKGQEILAEIKPMIKNFITDYAPS